MIKPSPPPIRLLSQGGWTHKEIQTMPSPELLAEANSPTTTNAQMSFSDALAHLKGGRRVARAGWNGKGMFLFLNKGSVSHLAPSATTIDGISSDLFLSGDTGTVTRLPNINMRSASGATITGWLASQSDLLADDWQIVD